MTITPQPDDAAVMVELIREVMGWHCDPDSPEYNECEREPCYWCEQAARVLHKPLIETKP